MWEVALAWRGTFILLLLGVMVLHYRHFILSYGSRWRALPSVLLLGAVVALLPMHVGFVASSKTLLSASLFLVLSEQQISVIGRERSPLFSLECGVVLGVLALYHPAYLFTAFTLMLGWSRLGFFTLRHLSGLVLGIIAPWLFLLPLLPQVNAEGIGSFFAHTLSPLLHVAMPTAPHLPYVGGAVVVWLLLMVLVARKYTRILGRHRYILVSHLVLALLFLVLLILYHAPAFALLSCFYALQVVQYLLLYARLSN